MVHVLCLRPRWCLMVRIAGRDVANSDGRSSVQVTTAAESVASVLPCDSAWPPRGVAISIRVGWPVSTSSVVSSMVGWVVAPPAAQPDGPRIQTVVAGHSAHPPSGRRSPAPGSASHEVSLQPICRQVPRSGNCKMLPCHTTPIRRQQCMFTSARPHAAEQGHVWHFVHVCPLCLGWREDSQALHTLLRLTVAHVLKSCVGVRLSAGASGESSVVNGP